MLVLDGGKLKSCMPLEGEKESNPWDKYLYPYPKTDRMKFYNSVVQDIYKAAKGRPDFTSYLREQQTFRWNTQTEITHLIKTVVYYESSASGVPKYCNVSKGNAKKCEKNVCASLLKNAEKTESDAQKLRTRLLQRREKLLDVNCESEVKKGCDEEHCNLSKSIVDLQAPLKKLIQVVNDLRNSYLHLSRSKIDSETTVHENARRKRRKKENNRKSKKQSEDRLKKRCEEILQKLIGVESATKLLPDVFKGNQIPTRICGESELKIQVLYTLKPKFHLKALKYLVSRNLFGGEALEHVECTIQRLSSLLRKSEDECSAESNVESEKELIPVGIVSDDDSDGEVPGTA